MCQSTNLSTQYKKKHMAYHDGRTDKWTTDRLFVSSDALKKKKNVYMTIAIFYPMG
jgi:hypothetical protein